MSSLPTRLMSDFMHRNYLREKFLIAGGETGAALRFLRQKRKGGQIEKAGPTLAKGSGDLRDVEGREWKRAGIAFVKTNRGVDLARKESRDTAA